MTTKTSQIITAAFQGRVVKLDVHAGQRIHKGDPVVKLDDTDLKSQIAGYLAEEKAAAAEAGAFGASAAAARSKLLAAQQLKRRGIASGMDVKIAAGEAGQSGAQSGAAAARGGVAKAKRDVAERQLAQAQINSPLAGVVMMVKAKEGAVFQQGEALARVFDPNELVIRFAVSREYRKEIALGGKIELTIEGLDRTIFANIDRIYDEEAPITFAVVEADIHTKLDADEVKIASTAKVRLAEKKTAKKVASK